MSLMRSSLQLRSLRRFLLSCFCTAPSRACSSAMSSIRVGLTKVFFFCILVSEQVSRAGRKPEQAPPATQAGAMFHTSAGDSRLRAVPAGRFFRVLCDEPEQAGAVLSPDDAPGSNQVGQDCGLQRAKWRTRAGVRQLPTGDLLTMQEGFHRAFVVGDLDLVHESVPAAAEHGPPCPNFHGGHTNASGASHRRASYTAMNQEEVWNVCTSRDPTFPYLLAAYQHFVRAGWALSSGLKYGATYLLYPAPAEIEQASANPGTSSCGRSSSAGAAHGHAPYAVYVVPPRLPVTAQGVQKRKRQEPASEGAGGGGVQGTTQEGIAGSESSERWAVVQSFSRLAANVSKKAIIAYVSYPLESPDQAGKKCCRGDDKVIEAADMKRMKIRELHLNRWMPASSGPDA